MEIQLARLDCAKMQLYRAMSLYMEGTVEAYICATSLAAGAEGIYGGYASAQGKTVAMKDLADFLSKRNNIPHKTLLDNHLNLIKNFLKHYDKGQPDSLPIEPEFEAFQMIARAMANYGLLHNDEFTPEMKKFSAITLPVVHKRIKEGEEAIRQATSAQKT